MDVIKPKSIMEHVNLPLMYQFFYEISRVADVTAVSVSTNLLLEYK